MSAKIEDGGPAAGTWVYGEDGKAAHYPGMSLRDWFAAFATETDIDTHRKGVWQDGAYLGMSSREAAKFAYADAMLAARTKAEGSQQ